MLTANILRLIYEKQRLKTTVITAAGDKNSHQLHHSHPLMQNILSILI